MKAMIRLLQGLLALVWIALLAGAVLLHVSEAAGDIPPQISGWACWTAEDSSMAPEIQKGDLAIIRMGAEARPGDPVLCQRVEEGGGLVLCRIIGTSEGQLILKGDGGENSFLAPPSAVAGVCETYLPGFGAPAEFLRSLPGIALIAIGGALLIVLGAAPRSGKNRRGSRRDAQPVEILTHGTRAGRNHYTPRH